MTIIILILIPNIVYAVKFRNQGNKCTNRAMNVLEQAGRYACMFLMVFNIGIAEFGFDPVTPFLIYGIGNVVLLFAYWLVWGLYFHRKDFWKSMALAIIPTGIFLLSGITLGHVLLVIGAVVFGIGHIYVTYENTK